MERVVVAELLRPRGNRGEVLARPLSDVPGRLESLNEAQVLLPTGADIPVKVERAWVHGEHWVFKFAGVDSISAAETLRDSDLWIPPEQRGQLPEGEYFESDLLGCSLVDQVSGQELGRVLGFERYGGPLLLELVVNGREVLVPFVPEICREVDVVNKRIKALLPDGLLDL
jgi:16S rRNA processing protein RimM